MNIIRKLIICIALLFFATAFSQEKLVNSLRIELKNSKDDIQTATVLNQLASAYQDFKALDYFLKCFKIQEKNKISSGITATNIAKIYLKQGD